MREMTKNGHFWSMGAAFSGKEAGKLQQGGKDNPRADGHGKARRAEKQQSEVYRKKGRGHASGDSFEHGAFLFAEPSRLAVNGTAEEKLDCGGGHETGEQNKAPLGGDQPDAEQERGEKQRGEEQAQAGGSQMEAAAEFPDEQEGQNHQHPLNGHAGGTAQKGSQKERRQAEQEAVGRVFVQLPVVFGNGSRLQEPFCDS